MKQLFKRWLQLKWYLIKLYTVTLLKVLIGKVSWNKWFSEIEMSKAQFRLKLWKSIYFNYRTMPSYYAKKMPVWIYGKINFYDLSGKVLFINDNIKSGMVNIGIMDPVRSSDSIASIELSGTIHLGNNIVIRQGTKFRIAGHLYLEDNTFIGDNSTIIISDNSRIQKNSIIAHNCIIMDTDIHYTLDITSHIVKRNSSPINIGRNNWIGAFTMVKKGVKTPSFLITIGPYSCLTKDYSKIFPEYACVGGCPVKLIRKDLIKANNITEKKLNTFFSSSDSNFFQYNDDINSFYS